MAFHGFSHADVRVRNLAQVEGLYDQLMPALGLVRKRYVRVNGDDWQPGTAENHNGVEYVEDPAPGRAPCFIGFIEDTGMKPTLTRIAFALPGHVSIGDWAARLGEMGAFNVELSESPEEYPAIFFEDACGTKLEILARKTG